MMSWKKQKLPALSVSSYAHPPPTSSVLRPPKCGLRRFLPLAMPAIFLTRAAVLVASGVTGGHATPTPFPTSHSSNSSAAHAAAVDLPAPPRARAPPGSPGPVRRGQRRFTLHHLGCGRRRPPYFTARCPRASTCWMRIGAAAIFPRVCTSLRGESRPPMSATCVLCCRVAASPICLRSVRVRACRLCMHVHASVVYALKLLYYTYFFRLDGPACFAVPVCTSSDTMWPCTLFYKMNKV
jgi:hypothetical protein